MLVPQEVNHDLDVADDFDDNVVDATEPTPPPPQQELIPSTSQEVAAEVAEQDANAQGRLKESQAQVYHIDLKHAAKVLSMQDDKADPVELKEVIEVVTTAKLD
nr:hypothetical protein [Tanacetum cinerariifolium]